MAVKNEKKKIVACVCELNPLHSGHKRLFDAVKTDLNPDVFAIVMSGNFTERGDISVKNKHVRAEWAIKAGADVVLELPFFYVVNCAEKFSEGAMKTLSSFNRPLTIAFGSESGNLDELRELSDKAHNETDFDKATIKKGLKDGLSLVKARAAALDENNVFTPNNTLAIEYLHAMKKYDFDAFTIKREGSFSGLETNGEYASAQAIRNCISFGKNSEISRFLPDFVNDTVDNCVFNDNVFDMISYKLNTMTLSEIAALPEVTEGLENRIKSVAETAKTYDELINGIKSKRYTMARIKRILLYALTGLDKSLMQQLYDVPAYARVLAVRNERKDVLKLLSNGNIVTSYSDVKNADEKIKRALEFENVADGVYFVASKQKENFNTIFVK